MKSTNPYIAPVHKEATPDVSQPRPNFVTILCMLLFVGTIAALTQYKSISNQAIGDWYAPYNACFVILQALCAIGMWKMKRVAFVAFIFVFTVNLLVHLIGVRFSFGAVVIYGWVTYFLVKATPSKVTPAKVMLPTAMSPTVIDSTEVSQKVTPLTVEIINENKVDSLYKFLYERRFDSGEDWEFGYSPAIIELLNSFDVSDVRQLSQSIEKWAKSCVFWIADPMLEVNNTCLDGHYFYGRCFLLTDDIEDQLYLLENMQVLCDRVERAVSFYVQIINKIKVFNEAKGCTNAFLLNKLKDKLEYDGINDSLISEVIGDIK